MKNRAKVSTKKKIKDGKIFRFSIAYSSLLFLSLLFALSLSLFLFYTSRHFHRAIRQSVICIFCISLFLFWSCSKSHPRRYIFASITSRSHVFHHLDFKKSYCDLLLPRQTSVPLLILAFLLHFALFSIS